MGINIEWKKRVHTILCSLVVLCIVVMVCRDLVRKEVENQLQENLKDVALQNEEIIEKEIGEKIRVLQVIAGDLQPMKDYKRIRYVSMLKPVANAYGFKRVSYTQGNGRSHTTDSYHKSVSNMEYFDKSINGKIYISDLFVDTIGVEGKVNVFSVPVFSPKGNTINGVVYATYRTEMFQELISKDSFDGQGFSCVIQEEGNFIARSNKFPKRQKFGNLFTLLQSENEDNASVIQELQIAMDKKRSGNITLFFGEEQYVYFSPIAYKIGGKKCYLLTFVPVAVMEERSFHLENYMNLLMVVCLLVFMIVGITFVHSLYHKRETLRRLAYQDQVTGGENYAYFEEKIEQLKQPKGYLVSLDTDAFKIVNQTCGVEKGNAVLMELYCIIKETLGQDDLLARDNADRFLVFYSGVDKEELLIKLNEISDKVRRLPHKLHIPKLSTYYGVYNVLEKVEDLDVVLNYANEARNVSKKKGKQKYAFYEEVDFQQISNENELKARFDDAVQNEEFEIWYQPKYCAQTKMVDGAEALVRWRNEDGTMIPPGQFIPVFEKNGMIAKLDEYVFKKVCTQQQSWRERGESLIPISINVSRATLYYENVVERYTEIAKETGVDPKYVPLEITESAMIDNVDVRELAEEFQNVGFPLHLDDFGTGYSSLATLNVMNFDTLKIDKSLVDHIGDKKGDTLLFHVIQLAKSMGMKVTAEGVETEEQLMFLQEKECTNIQGYFFSKPLPVHDFEKKCNYCNCPS